MHGLRTALVAGALVFAGLGGRVAAADGDMCVDDQATCPSGLSGDDPSAADGFAQPTPVPSPDAQSAQVLSPDTQPGSTRAVGPPGVVEPFRPVPAMSAAPLPAPPVIAPGNGADDQHLPPGPANRVVDP